jgi:hypothetical protein
MSGILDRILGAAPGIVAKGMAGKQAGEDRRRKQLIEDEERSQATQREALQRMLLQEQVDTAPARRTLLEAQSTKARADAEHALRPPAASPVRGVESTVMRNGKPTVVLTDPTTGREIRELGEARPPAPAQPQIVMGVDPNGNPAAFRVPRAGGAASPIEGMTPVNPEQRRADAQIRISEHQIAAAATGLRGLQGWRPNDAEIANALKNPNLSIVSSDERTNQWFAHIAELAALEAAIRGRGGKGAIDQIKAALMRDPSQLEGAIRDAESGLARLSGGAGPAGENYDAERAELEASRKRRIKKP